MKVEISKPGGAVSTQVKIGKTSGALYFNARGGFVEIDSRGRVWFYPGSFDGLSENHAPAPIGTVLTITVDK